VKEKFELILKSSEVYKSDPGGVHELWDRLKDRIYSLSAREQSLGLGDKVRHVQGLVTRRYYLKPEVVQ